MNNYYLKLSKIIAFSLLFSYVFIIGTTIVLAQEATSPSGEDNHVYSNGTVIPKVAEEKVDLVSPPSQIINFDIRNPGNSPFIHDETYSNMTDRYGTIRNEKAYLAFGKIIEFGIKTLIKLVGVMALFGITEGIVRLVISHGEEEVHANGVKMIMWSTVGLILALIAHAVVTALLQFILGVGDVSI